MRISGAAATQNIMVGFLSIAVVSPISAFADTVTWKDDIRGWHIVVDRTVGPDCFMVTAYDGGSILRAGFDFNEYTFDFYVANENWLSIESGKYYPISIRFGNRTPWTGDGKGIYFGRLPSIGINIQLGDDSILFIDELMKMTNVVIHYDGKFVANLSLSGTYAAMLEVLECQSAFVSTSGDVSVDPFSHGRPRPSADPFR